MIIQLKQVFDIVGESIPFDYQLDLSEYELYGTYPFVTPVFVKGQVCNTAQVVTVSYDISCTLNLTCDRCLEEFIKEFSLSSKQILVSEGDAVDDEEYMTVEDYSLDLDRLCLDDILLNLPSKFLCKEDCKGLCPKCGKNLNSSDCLCVKKEIDPRLAALSQLLE